MNSPPSTPSSFVTVMAWISIALGVMGVVSGILQGVMLAVLPPSQLLQGMAGGGLQGVPMPPGLAWLLEHLALLNFLSLLSSAVFTVVAYGLLKRRRWGRTGFACFLGLSALGGVAGAAGFGHVLAAFGGLAGADPAAIDPTLQSLQTAMVMVLYVGAALIAVLHGAIIWKLFTPAISAEFAR